MAADEHRLERELVDLTTEFLEYASNRDDPLGWLAEMLSPENNPLRTRAVQSWALVKVLADMEADALDLHRRLVELEGRLDGSGSS